MNREIKFRAWDGEKMHLPEYSDKEDFHLLPDGTIVETHEHGYERHELTTARGDNWIVMQYTGRKDKNGVEIYEGDFVACVTKTDWKFPNSGLVEYLPITASFAIYTGTNHLSEEEPAPKLYTWFDYNEGFEIIGNIHANPDLLP